MRRPPLIAIAMGFLLLFPALAWGTSATLSELTLDAAHPTVTVTGVGVPGKLVVIDGRGFKANSAYQVYWDSSTPIRFVWPNSKGTFHGHLRIPAKASDGSHVATFAPANRAKAVSVVKGALAMSAMVRQPAVLKVQVRVRRNASGGNNSTGSSAGPTISNVAAGSITEVRAVVSWNLSEPATGQVEYGTTTAYGSVTAPELSFDFSNHVQQVSPLVPGTRYHFRVRSQDAAGNLSVSADETFTTTGGAGALAPDPTTPPDPTATPDPTPTPAPGATGLYGSGLNFDTKANLRVGPDGTIAHRFVASTTSTLQSIRFQQRGGPIYSGGTGGKFQISVQADAAGVPSGTVLASASYSPGNPSGDWTTYDVVSFSSPATLTRGTRYDIVFQNVDANPTSNYFSVNELFVYGATMTPRQPAFADADYAVLAANSAGSWSVQGKYTADMDLTYANGTHDGMAYIENIIALYGTVSGTASVREHFTVSGGNRTVSSASVRVRRSGGSAPLTLRLETGTGTLIEAGDVPASSVPVSAAGGDNGGSVWVTVTFATPHNLASGTAYNLRLTTASGTTYTAAPIREGTDQGLQSYAFRDGSGQGSSNGTSWADLYAYSPVDLQFYFR